MVTKLLSQINPNNCEGNSCLSRLPEVKANEDQLQNGLTIVFGVFAAVAVLVIIIAAIKFATSDGNPDEISRAKKIIIYALLGLVISLSAEIIVRTLIGRI